MAQFLILYSTVDGHCLAISERLRDKLQQAGHEAKLVSISDEPDIDPAPYDRIVIGASIRYGRHSPLVLAYIKRHAAALAAKQGALFSVNLVARKPGKDTPDTNPYLRRFLRKLPWQPELAAVFAGKLDYPRYTALDRTIIRLIMWITGGPTDPTAVIEFTDWDKVDAFGDRLRDVHGAGGLAAPPRA